MEKKTFLILIFIVVLGAMLRFVLLTWSPPSLNWDEVSHGVNAYSILKTGMDQWGETFPVFNFRAYGDYPTTLNLYLTISFLVIFGLSEFAIRFPHALLGTLTIISVYFLTFGITKKQNISLLAAFLTAIGPWYVFTSRFVLQSNLSVFLLITAAALFVNRDKNRLFFSLSSFLFTLTLFSYHTTRIFSPLFLVGLLVIYRNEIKNKFVYLFSAVFVILTIFILFNPEATARSKYLSILDQGAINKIETLQNKYGRVVANKLTFIAYKFGSNYISYFSPKFLFLNGGTQYQFSVPNFGLIYPVSLPFFYVGLILLIIKSISDKNYRFILLWLILAPIPASLTNESYAVLRATTMLPIPEILIGLGFYFVLGKLSTKFRLFTTLMFIVIIVFFAESYFVNYFTKYRTDYSWSWQYGYREAIYYVKDNYDNYDKIIITKKYAEPHEYFLFYLKYDPAKYLNDQTNIAFKQSNWYWVDRFDKYYFVNDWQVKDLVTESKIKIDCSNIRCLLITSPNNYPNGFKKIKDVSFLDGKVAFEIYEHN